MNFKRITLMIKNNLGAITNSYKAKNPLKKKKIGNILLYGIIFLYLIFVEYMALSNLINSIGETNIIESVAKISPMFVAFLVIMSVFFVEFLRIINVNKTIFMRSFPITKKERYIVDISNTIITSLKFPLFIFITGGIIFNILTGFKYLGLMLSLIYMTIIIGTVVTIPTVIIVKLIYMLIGKFTTRKVIEKLITFTTFFIGFGIYLLFDIYNEPVMKFINKITNENFNIFGRFTDLLLGSEILKSTCITLIFTVIITGVMGIVDYLLYAVTEKISLNMPTKMFGVNLSKEKSLEKGIKNIAGRKKGRDKTYLSYEINFYKRSPIIIFQTILPIVIVPIILLIGFYSGMNRQFEEFEKEHENYKYIVAQTGEERSINIIEKVKNDGPDKTLEFLTKEGAVPVTSMNDIGEVLRYLNTKKFVGIDGIQDFIKNGIPKEVKNMISNEIIGIIIIGVGTAAVLFNYLGAIVISKDKDNISFLKTLPITFKKQYQMKLISPKVLSLGIFIIYYLILAIAFKETLITYYPVLGLITAILIIINNIEFAGMLDLIRPNFNWKSETELTKRSLNSFLWTLLMIAKSAMYGYIATKNALTDSIHIFIGIEIGLFILIYAIKYLYLNKLFIRLEKDH